MSFLPLSLTHNFSSSMSLVLAKKQRRATGVDALCHRRCQEEARAASCCPAHYTLTLHHSLSFSFSKLETPCAILISPSPGRTLAFLTLPFHGIHFIHPSDFSHHRGGRELVGRLIMMLGGDAKRAGKGGIYILLGGSSSDISAQQLELLIQGMNENQREIKVIGKAKREDWRGKDPPGRCGFPFIGETISFLSANNSSKGFYHFVRTRRLRYGKCFKTNIFRKTHVFVSSTEAAKSVLGSDFVSFRKSYMRSIGELVGEKSLLCASHQDHTLIRTRLSHLFTKECISSFLKHFDLLTTTTLQLWDQGDTVVVLHETLKITFMAICKMVMSLEDAEEVEMLQKDVSEISDAMLAFPLKLPWTRFYKGLKARRRFMERVKRTLILRRQGLECHHQDFLRSLLSPHDFPLTDEQILDNILTLIIAGQVTTASAMTWMVKYLDENQDVQDKLRILQLALLDKSLESSLTAEDLNEMPYASKVVKESLRMASVVPWFPRVALRDCQIEGFRIRKGWIVNVDARSIHYDPTVYEDPTKFQPSRFDEDSQAYSFLAFGTGGRTCIGMNLAKYMMLVFLHRLLTTYRWKVIDSDASLESATLFPRLKNGCPIRVFRISSK